MAVDALNGADIVDDPREHACECRSGGRGDKVRHRYPGGEIPRTGHCRSDRRRHHRAMQAIWAICRRDLIFLFTTPLAWLVLAVWIFATNFVFYFGGIEHAASVGFAYQPLYMLSLQAGAIALTPLAPAMTMHSFAAERVQGTMQLLLTVPIREHSLIVGKFLAAFLMLAVMLGCTLVQPAVLYFVSETGGTQLLAGYAGMLMLCALLSALGIWISLLVEHPIAAYVITFGAIAILQLLGVLSYVENSVISEFGKQVGLLPRLNAFLDGDLRLANLFYFVGGAVIFLSLAHSSVCARRLHG